MFHLQAYFCCKKWSTLGGGALKFVIATTVDSGYFLVEVKFNQYNFSNIILNNLVY